MQSFWYLSRWVTGFKKKKTSFRSAVCFSCFSAGVGRSGTFVTLLWLMQLCVRGIQPSIRAAVEDLRLHRMWMVQNLVSYNTQQTRIQSIMIHLLKITWWSLLGVFVFLWFAGPVHFCSPVSPPLARLESCSMVGKTDQSPKSFLSIHGPLIFHLFCRNLQIPRAGINNHVQGETSGSRTERSRAGRRKRRAQHHAGQTPLVVQPQSRVQQILNPGNLLRRLLPSSPLFNSDSQTSWKHKAG